jgi:DNA-binding transcriptional regulator YhcF (GntR family)
MSEKSKKPIVEQITDKMEELEVDKEQNKGNLLNRILDKLLSIF